MTTVTFTLPDAIYNDAQKMLETKQYLSISDLIQDSLKKLLYKKKLTVNGFTEEFEDEVLRRAAEPIENDIVLETDEEVENFFRYLQVPARYDKN